MKTATEDSQERAESAWEARQEAAYEARHEAEDAKQEVIENMTDDELIDEAARRGFTFVK